MKHMLSALCLCFLTASAAHADDVNKADLYSSSIGCQNRKWKEGFGGSLNVLTSPQKSQLESYAFTLMKQECDCTFTAVFKSLSESTIGAYNSALIAKKDGITLRTEDAAKDFKKSRND